MSFTEMKRREIKRYILRKIAADEEKFQEKVMDNFGVSVTSVKRYLQEFLSGDDICVSPEKKCGYALVNKCCEVVLSIPENIYEEDRIYANDILPYLGNCGKRAEELWQYVCAEILNNALEHSKGETIRIRIVTNCLYTVVTLCDDGVGVFHTLIDVMREKGWVRPRVEDVLIELMKGKMTSAPQQHSGEGIFFSSKMVDYFVLWSDGNMLKWGARKDMELIRSHLLAYESKLGKVGTCVMMVLENESTRDIKKVFDTYANADSGFFRTEISVMDSCFGTKPVARSQARRICKRLEEFKEVVLDFEDVDFMGQGFADELFRVYALSRPEIVICAKNASADVLRMIHHVSRGNLPANVRINGSKVKVK